MVKKTTKRKTEIAESGHVRFRLLAELKPSPENFQPLGLYKPILPDDPATVELVESIREHGFNSVMVISADDYILSGHRRQVAAQVAGVLEVPCIVDPVYRRDPGSPFVTTSEFIAKLEAYNRQRVKTLDELLRESIVKTDPNEAHRALSEYRERKSFEDITAETVELRGYKRRARISDAKTPMVNAIIRALNKLRNEWPLTDRDIHYELLNDPPLRHASKPKMVYNNTSKKCFNRKTCRRKHNKNGQHLNSGPDCYKDLCDMLLRMRLCGMIPWSCIDDPTRPITITECWREAGEFLTEHTSKFLKGYYRDLMQSQTNHIEIMYEKEAGYSTIKRVAMQHCIPLTVGRGSCSGPPRQQLAERYRASGKDRLIVLAMSDLDPDGDEIAHSFARSMRDDFGIEDVALVKVALTMDQAREFNLPESGIDRAKPSSSNYAKYVERYGTTAIWELQALPRPEQKRLMVEAIESVIDIDAYNYEVEQEKKESAYIEDKRKGALLALGDFANEQNTESGER